MITDRDITVKVSASLASYEGDFNIPAIVDEIQTTYGLVDIDTIEHDAYWAIVARHEN